MFTEHIITIPCVNNSSNRILLVRVKSGSLFIRKSTENKD